MMKPYTGRDIISTKGHSRSAVLSFIRPSGRLIRYFFLSSMGWHTLPSHASAEACLSGWPNAQHQDGTCVVLRDNIRLANGVCGVIVARSPF